MNSVTLDNAVLFQAECQRVRARARTILAEARMLQEQLDQTGGLLDCALPVHEVRTDWVPLVAGNPSYLQHSLAAA